MQVYERITASQFQLHAERIAGFKISRVWLGYAHALFLECGRLKKEGLPTKKKSEWSSMGQVTFMLDGIWRVEKKRSVDFGMYSSDRILNNRIENLAGCRISSILTTSRVPELSIELDDGRIISTFTASSSLSSWSIAFRDLNAIDIDPEWYGNDVSVWLSYKKGTFRRSYCFDEKEITNKKLRKIINSCHMD
jgi:hypothetical protein